MPPKKPNKFIAPVVIAGITVGFLASAYKFVFAKPKKKSQENEHIEAQADLYTDSESSQPKSEE